MKSHTCSRYSLRLVLTLAVFLGSAPSLGQLDKKASLKAKRKPLNVSSKNHPTPAPHFLAHLKTRFACGEGAIEWMDLGTRKTETRIICTNEDATILLSERCFKGECAEFNTDRRWTFRELHAPVGRAGHHLCRQLGGTPQLIKFHIENEAWPLDRCLFESGEFVDTGLLMDRLVIGPGRSSVAPPFPKPPGY